MLSLFKKYSLQRIATFLLAITIMAMTVVCTTTSTSTIDHHADKNSVCESVVELASNAIIQTGLIVLLLIATAWLSIGGGIFNSQFELNLRLSGLYKNVLRRRTSSREYSYLCQLFSSGITHSKLHSIAI